MSKLTEKIFKGAINIYCQLPSSTMERLSPDGWMRPTVIERDGVNYLCREPEVNEVFPDYDEFQKINYDEEIQQGIYVKANVK